MAHEHFRKLRLVIYFTDRCQSGAKGMPSTSLLVRVNDQSQEITTWSIKRMQHNPWEGESFKVLHSYLFDNTKSYFLTWGKKAAQQICFYSTW